ncbi:hypothetical protein H9639_05135 [Arthrobacter sp. Sa2CUA1]|uniref:Uncharacterized protein n=1 Tax=Arthrobacter gallicola TaxID=2762225 RepID=A0ABR8UQ24_9MICC|nr:hypothetical protein [Arthrobacter gallicola]MBD7994677.1 hypothetical protein [Arthrobacter gallicola]
MSTESGSTAAGERRRRAEDIASGQGGSAGSNPEGSEPDVTRPLNTSGATDPRRNDTEVLREGHARHNDTEVISTDGPRANDTRVLNTDGPRHNDTEVLNTGNGRQNDTEILGHSGARHNDTQVLGTSGAGAGTAAAGTRTANARAAAAGNRATDGTRADAEVTGTRDPNDSAYRTDHTDYTEDTRADGNQPDRNRRESSTQTRHAGRGPRAQGLPNREGLLAAERERFGGIKFGAAFFGWLTATGMVVLLSAAAAAIGAAVGVSTDTDLGAALEQAAANQSAGLTGAIITLAVLLLAYYAGGYVAGRMARFNGLKQGLAVWLWALVAAAVVIVLGLVFGNDIRSITQLNSVAPLPEDLGDISFGTWLAVAASLVVSLIGALLGGLAGMRFHRRVDRAHFPAVQETD